MKKGHGSQASLQVFHLTQVGVEQLAQGESVRGEGGDEYPGAGQWLSCDVNVRSRAPRSRAISVLAGWSQPRAAIRGSGSHTSVAPATRWIVVRLWERCACGSGRARVAVAIASSTYR